MSQTEVCIVTCDGPLCEATFTAEDWDEVHEEGRAAGWRFTSVEDLCRDCH